MAAALTAPGALSAQPSTLLTIGSGGGASSLCLQWFPCMVVIPSAPGCYLLCPRASAVSASLLPAPRPSQAPSLSVVTSPFALIIAPGAGTPWTPSGQDLDSSQPHPAPWFMDLGYVGYSCVSCHCFGTPERGCVGSELGCPQGRSQRVFGRSGKPGPGGLSEGPEGQRAMGAERA